MLVADYYPYQQKWREKVAWLMGPWKFSVPVFFVCLQLYFTATTAVALVFVL
jgi:hypothetical protein